MDGAFAAKLKGKLTNNIYVRRKFSESLKAQGRKRQTLAQVSTKTRIRSAVS